MKKKNLFIIGLAIFSLLVSGCNADSIDAKAPNYTGMSIANQKRSTRKLRDVEVETKYTLHKNEEFLFEIHFDNPYEYEIQSFTINEKKYANYMFEDGSTLDVLYLKSIAPNEYGTFSYTIDAIKYIDGESIKDVRMSGDKTIDIEVVPYKVTLDPNGGEVDGTFIAIDSGSLLELPTPRRRGYDFVGWYDENNYKVTDGTFTYNRDMSLTARWKIVNYQIEYYLNGGHFNEEYPLSYTVESSDITLNIPTKLGYTFQGWFDSENKKIETISHGSTGNLFLSASWTVNKYKITLLSGFDDIENQEIELDFGDTYWLPELSRTGYTFLGWFDSEYNQWTIGNYNVDHDTILTASWELISYNISYELNGGAQDYSNPSTYTVVSEDIELKDPSRDGYTFLGWFDSENNKIETIPTGSIGDLALSAKWSAIKYVLTVTINRTSEGAVEITGEGYTDEQITVTAIPEENCVFVGWYDSDGNLVNDQDEFTFTMPAHDYYLEARFYIARTYTENGYTYEITDIITENEVAKLVSIDETVADFELPDTIDGAKVVDLDETIFAGNQNLKSIVMPDFVTEICESMFEGCDQLKTAVLGKNIETIKSRAFYGCSRMTSIEIKEGVSYIGEGAFGKCTSLETFEMPNSVETIGRALFADDKHLQSVKLSNSLTVLKDQMFYNCDSLTFVDIPEGVTKIEGRTFDNCEKLTAVTMPSTIKTIEDSAFTYSWNIASIYCKCSKDVWDDIMHLYSHDYDDLYQATAYFYNESTTEEGAYWYYDDENIVAYYNFKEGLRIEAEDSTRYGGQVYSNVGLATSGDKCIGSFPKGSSIVFNVNFEEETTRRLYFRCVFSNDTTVALSTEARITVNGQEIDTSSIVVDPFTGYWYMWVDYDLGNITFNQGDNTIVFENINHDINVDCIILAPAN